MKMRPMLPAAAALLAGLFGHAQLQAADNLAEAFKQGEAHVDFRYRFEYVDQEGFTEDAEASTLRGRINFKTDPLRGFYGFAEVDYITDIIWDDYNAGAGNTPDKEQYPVVADPTGTDLNQSYLGWNDGKGNLFKGGRQRIIFDNARFIGNVGWRQNEQTFDAAYFQHNDGGVDIQLGYVWRVNRIFGDDVPAGENDHSTALVNLSRSWEGSGKLVAYFYDIDNEDNAAQSNRSYGLRWTGSAKLSEKPLDYALEYAHQNDTANNPVNYSSDYYRAEVSLGLGRLTPTIGYESLGGDDSRSGAAFQTPLATLHAFDGWADQFLTTPAAGVNDLFLGVKGSLGVWTWNLIYHDFEAESGSAAYGSEIDASINRKFGEHYGLLLGGAVFDGASGSTFSDTTKLWVQFTADF